MDYESIAQEMERDADAALRHESWDHKFYMGKAEGLRVAAKLLRIRGAEDQESQSVRHVIGRDTESKSVGRTWWLHVDGSGRIVSAAATRRGAHVFRPREDGERVIEVAEVQSTECRSVDGALDRVAEALGIHPGWRTSEAYVLGWARALREEIEAVKLAARRLRGGPEDTDCGSVDGEIK